MTIRMTGMYSNLDTDSIISQLMKAQRTKIEAIEKKKTTLEWKVDAWKTLNAKIYALYTGTLSEMRYTNFYGDKATTISDSSVATVSASTSAVDGTQELAVKQVAKSGYLTGAQLATTNSTTLSSSSTLSDLGYSGTGTGTIDVKVGSKTVSVSVSETSKISDVISQLKSAGVNASFDATNKRIFVSSTESGADANFTISASDSNGLAALNALGLNASSDADNEEYEIWEKYQGLTYIADYAGTDQNQIAYNAEYLATYNSDKTTLENSKTTAENTLDGILEKYNTDYTSADRETAYNELVGQKDSLTTYKTELEAQVSDYTTQIDDAKAIIEDENATAEEKLEAENKLQEAQDKLSEASAFLAETSTKLTDIENATGFQDAIEGIDSALEESTLSAVVQNKLQAKAAVASDALVGGHSSGAVKVEGQDAEITLNGATFTSSTNAFSVNGLNIVAKSVTGTTTNASGDTVYNTVSVTTSVDYEGIYNKIKAFLTEYNALISEMDSLYNADSSKGYEPLTDDEREAMTDDQIEKWETKIKDALLRRDSTLSDVTSTLKNGMSSTFEINGTKYSLASFGIATASYFTTDANSKGVYHIDGDSEDSTSSGNSDKLMSALASDPEAVSSFFMELSKNLYSSLNKKMTSIQGMRSVYNVYDDKKMASDIEDYEDAIEKLEAKFTAMEDRYYKQFSAMETALAKLQSSSSALTSLLGSS